MTQEKTTKTYEELLTQYNEIDKQIKQLEETKNELRKEVAECMHEHNVNELSITDNHGTDWACVYQTTTRKSTDYAELLEYVGSEMFNEIVNEKTTTSLVIRRAKKKKSDDKTNKKPHEEKSSSSKKAPKGVIIS